MLLSWRVIVYVNYCVCVKCLHFMGIFLKEISRNKKILFPNHAIDNLTVYIQKEIEIGVCIWVSVLQFSYSNYWQTNKCIDNKPWFVLSLMHPG